MVVLFLHNHAQNFLVSEVFVVLLDSCTFWILKIPVVCVCVPWLWFTRSKQIALSLHRQNHQTQPSDYFQSKIQNEAGVAIVIEATVLMQVALANSMFQQHY